MVSAWGQLRDTLHLVRQGGPALCNIAITNSCNATCDFCNFANGKIARQKLRWMDADRLNSALQILHATRNSLRRPLWRRTASSS